MGGMFVRSLIKTDEINWKKNGNINMKYPVVRFRVRYSMYQYDKVMVNAISEKISKTDVIGRWWYSIVLRNI
jgi:hypothetical protein